MLTKIGMWAFFLLSILFYYILEKVSFYSEEMMMWIFNSLPWDCFHQSSLWLLSRWGQEEVSRMRAWVLNDCLLWNILENLVVLLCSEKRARFFLCIYSAFLSFNFSFFQAPHGHNTAARKRVTTFFLAFIQLEETQTQDPNPSFWQDYMAVSSHFCELYCF